MGARPIGPEAGRHGKIEEGIALRQARGSASNRFDGLWLSVAAEGQLHAGRWEAASATLSEAFEKSKRTHDLPWVANLHCARSHISLHGPLQSRELAERDLLEAIDIARLQSAKLLELRATTSLARLWAEKGRRAEARELLAPIYGWFTEGFGTADVKEAKALLPELA